MPGIPTIAESGVQYNLSVWTGFFAPSGVSSEIMSKLRSELMKALSDPAIAKKISEGGGEPTEGVELFRQRIKDELATNRRIAVARNIRVE